MIAFKTVIEYLWTALLGFSSLASCAMVISTAWTGKFWWFRVKNGRRWPPLRSENPVKFWLLWMLYGGPLLLVPLLIILGIIASLSTG